MLPWTSRRRKCLLKVALFAGVLILLGIGGRWLRLDYASDAVMVYFNVSESIPMKWEKNASKVETTVTTASNFPHTCDIPLNRSVNSLARRFPHIIIVGFGKAGTRAVYQMIRMHPDVVGPPDEMRFFSDSVKYERGISFYVRLMPATTLTQKTIEKSPVYITEPAAILRLKKALEGCHRMDHIKFVAVFRDPFERTVSEYVQHKVWLLNNKGRKLAPFEELCLKKSGEVNNLKTQVNSSIYVYHMKNWLKYFDMNKMCFVHGDVLVKDPFSQIKKLERCLELRDYIKPSHFYLNKLTGFYCPVDPHGRPKCLGPGKGRPHPKINNEIEQKFREFFKPYNKELSEITGMNFNWS